MEKGREGYKEDHEIEQKGERKIRCKTKLSRDFPTQELKQKKNSKEERGGKPLKERELAKN